MRSGLFRWGVKLQQIAFAVKEIETAATRTIHGGRGVNSHSPILHFLLCQFEIIAADSKRLVRRPFPFNEIIIHRFRTLKQDHHAVARAKIGARQPLAHIVAIELCYGPPRISV